MRDENQSYLQSYTDQELTDLNRETAQKKLKIDLANRFNFNTVDTTILDDLANNYQDSLELALTYLQLESFYTEASKGDNSITYNRMVRYMNSYTKLFNTFDNFKITVTHTLSSTTSRGYSL
jgi:hypothetical protein